MTRRLSAALWLAMLFGTAAEFRAQQPTFRAFADVVSVDVSVKTGRVPVAGLTTADFEVRDNGVAQQLDAVSIEAVPIDVTLAVDLSGSVVAQREGLQGRRREVRGDASPCRSRAHRLVLQ